ncbi:hypothetical protein TNCV_1750141 [Trichonephila clavipes]|nr:hypothetical protein TNCV_1750141 [Trichonephila clavipes]
MSRAGTVVRKVLRKCVPYFRHKSVFSQQLMGDLPVSRMNPGRAFFKSGIDFAGSLQVKSRRGRESNLCNKRISLCDRWKLLQQMTVIVEEMVLDYLTQVQQRRKWQKQRRNLKINDLVLLQEDNLPPFKWKVHEGPDGKVCVVNLKTPSGELKTTDS